MSNKEDTPTKVPTSKKSPKKKSNLSTPLKNKKLLKQTIANCSECDINFKSPLELSEHNKNKHTNSVKKTKFTKKVFTPKRAHSGVPPTPKLRDAFRSLKAKLEERKLAQP